MQEERFILLHVAQLMAKSLDLNRPAPSSLQLDMTVVLGVPRME